MEMYNSKRELISFDGFEYLNEGKCAKVYKRDHEVFKLYKHDTKYNYFLSKKMFKTIKKLNLSTIVSLYDYYYYYDDFFSRHSLIDGYSMGYVEKDKSLVIDKPTDYLLYIANKFDETVEILTTNNVLIRDPHYGNIVFGKEAATLIDVDTYEFCHLVSHQDLKQENQRAILDILSSQLIHELRTDNPDEYLFVSKYLSLFTPDTNKSIKEIIKETINENTPRKSIGKIKRLI